MTVTMSNCIARFEIFERRSSHIEPNFSLCKPSHRLIGLDTAAIEAFFHETIQNEPRSGTYVQQRRACPVPLQQSSVSTTMRNKQSGLGSVVVIPSTTVEEIVVAIDVFDVVGW